MFWKYLQNDHLWVFPSSLQSCLQFHMCRTHTHTHTGCRQLVCVNHGSNQRLHLFISGASAHHSLTLSGSLGGEWAQGVCGVRVALVVTQVSEYGCGRCSHRDTPTAHSRKFNKTQGVIWGQGEALILNFLSASTFMHLKLFCFPSTFRGKPCRAGRSCFDSLCSKLSSLSSHGFIHKIKIKAWSLNVLRQLSVYSNRGEKGEFFKYCFFLFLFACALLPFWRRDDDTCKTRSDFDPTPWVGNYKVGEMWHIREDMMELWQQSVVESNRVDILKCCTFKIQ